MILIQQNKTKNHGYELLCLLRKLSTNTYIQHWHNTNFDNTINSRQQCLFARLEDWWCGVFVLYFVCLFVLHVPPPFERWVSNRPNWRLRTHYFWDAAIVCYSFCSRSYRSRHQPGLIIPPSRPNRWSVILDHHFQTYSGRDTGSYSTRWIWVRRWWSDVMFFVCLENKVTSKRKQKQEERRWGRQEDKEEGYIPNTEWLCYILFSGYHVTASPPPLSL